MCRTLYVFYSWLGSARERRLYTCVTRARGAIFYAFKTSPSTKLLTHLNRSPEIYTRARACVCVYTFLYNIYVYVLYIIRRRKTIFPDDVLRTRELLLSHGREMSCVHIEIYAVYIISCGCIL